MKIIKYNVSVKLNRGTVDEPKWDETLTPSAIRCSESMLDANLAIAAEEAYNGEYTIEDDGVEEIHTPSQLDIIEAQVTYTAMMTDTLLEV